MEQNPDYILAAIDPLYIIERATALMKRDPQEDQTWRYKLGLLDPSHPKAIVPEWVRFAKRKNQDFRCHILGWKESDWMVNKTSREIQQVGMLTLDHTLAAAHGGLTTDANTMMVAEIANNKKGSKMKSYEEMRQFLHSIYELYVPTNEELMAIESFRSKRINKVRL